VAAAPIRVVLDGPRSRATIGLARQPVYFPKQQGQVAWRIAAVQRVLELCRDRAVGRGAARDRWVTSLLPLSSSGAASFLACKLSMQAEAHDRIHASERRRRAEGAALGEPACPP
jgi:hypothetical protein